MIHCMCRRTKLRRVGTSSTGAKIYAYAPGEARRLTKALRSRGYNVTVDPPRGEGTLLVSLPRPTSIYEAKATRWDRGW